MVEQWCSTMVEHLTYNKFSTTPSGLTPEVPGLTLNHDLCPEDEAQRKQQKCDIRKQKQQARLVHTHRPRASSKSTAGGAKHRTQELSTRSARDTLRDRRVRVIKA